MSDQRINCVTASRRKFAMELRQRKPSVLESLKELDAYAKPLEDFQVKTVSGATVTLVSLVLVFLLLTSEFHDWLSREFIPAIRIDPGRKEKMAIYLDVTFPHLPCFIVGIDVMDSAGDYQNDVHTDMFKQRINRDTGKPVADKVLGVIAEKTHHDLVQAKNNGTYCGDCYGAAEGCCNTCESVQKAYENKGWSIKELDNYQQCVDEGEAQKIKDQAHEGCNIHGKLLMNKVGGSLHFAPGKSYTRNGVHAHDLTQYVKSTEFDWTHHINDLRFGETVGFSNPLDGVEKKATGAWSKHEYFLKVVRTDFTYLNGSVISTNQFSVTEHDKVIPTIMGMPSDMPDISPMLITYTEYQKPFSHFLTDTCAIVGGIFTMAGLIDGLIYTAEKKLGAKMDLGKAS